MRVGEKGLVADGAALHDEAAADGEAHPPLLVIGRRDVEGDRVARVAAAHIVGGDAVLAGDGDVGVALVGRGLHGAILGDELSAAQEQDGGDEKAGCTRHLMSSFERGCGKLVSLGPTPVHEAVSHPLNPARLEDAPLEDDRHQDRRDDKQPGQTPDRWT